MPDHAPPSPVPARAAVLVPVAAPERLTARQTLFCQRVAAGASGAEAARQAGYSPNGAAQQASRLLRNPAIAAEIERLVSDPETRQRAEMDRLLAKVEGVFAKAVRDGQCSSALRAVELEALLRDRGARSLPDGVTVAEIEAEIEGESPD